ncbi:MAG TPA: glycogen-binding domain-containing protein [Gemmatimonadales bacterium]|nr:glycogen-binding domain-containing protein [Gemmatimonadales bacterium]
MRAPAQTTGTLALGVSTVRYDGFLPSGAVTVTPAVRWERPTAGVSAQGTYLLFESGHESQQGGVTGWLFTAAPSQRWRGELSLSTGASRYLDFASFWHFVGAARLHLLGQRRGAWIGGTAGTTSYGAAPRRVTIAGAGAWWRLPDLTVHVAANRSRVGDTIYTDFQASTHAERSGIALDATLGARVWSWGAGSGAYGEASAAIALSERAALVLGGGRYPSDPVRGSLAARYLTAGVSLRLSAPRRFGFRPPASPRGASADGPPADPGVRLDVQVQWGEPVRLVVHAPDATRVELAGDFTDWEPVLLTSAGPGIWETSLQITSGMHRVNVRIDGGAWLAPTGVTRATDDFGGEVGTFAVP